MYINLNNKNKPSEEGQTTNYKIESKEYSILNDYCKDDSCQNYLIMKENVKDYETVFNFGIGKAGNIIGVYNHKLYYTSKNYVKYIDLNNESFDENLWITLPDKGLSGFLESKIINDTLYFEFDFQNAGMEKYKGIYTLDMNAKSFNESKKIISEPTEKWYIDNNYIYYLKNEETKNYIPYEYNIKTKETKNLFDIKYDVKKDSIDFKYQNGKIIYAIFHDESFDCNLYLYDTNTKKSIDLGKTTSRLPSQNLDSIATITDEKIYYRIDDTIYSYNIKDGSKNSYYSLNNLPSACSKDCYLNFEAINNNTLKITYNINSDINPTPVQYVVNGKNVDSLDKVNVKMLDGNMKSFSIEDVKSLNN